MTQRRFPFAYADPEDDPGVNIGQWSLMARNWGGDGVIGHAGGSVAEVFADNSGLQVKVRAGVAQLRGHLWESDAVETVEVDANASGSPRIDLVVLRLDPTNEPDFITLEVLTGTPASSPVEPALTRTYTGIFEVPLGAVRVESGASSIAADKVFERREFQPTGIPTGGTLWWPGLLDAQPAGFLPVSHAPVSRNTFYNLFKKYGTAWGAGDGVSTFNIPPPGFVPVGVDPAVAEFNTLGKKFGAVKHTLTAAEMPSHAHPASSGSSTVPGQFRDVNGSQASGSIRTGQTSGHSLRAINDSHHSHTVTVGATGGGQSHNNVQPSMAGFWLIKT
ncbi:MAG: hypothetical protein WC054_02765 [Candidatus Nanopelagicales bacterium]